MKEKEPEVARPWYQKPLSERPDYIGNMSDLAGTVTCPATEEVKS